MKTVLAGIGIGLVIGLAINAILSFGVLTAFIGLLGAVERIHG